MQEEMKLDLSKYGLQHEAIITAVYTKILGVAAPGGMWSDIMMIETVMSDIARLDACITADLALGISEQVIVEKLLAEIDVVHKCGLGVG